MDIVSYFEKKYNTDINITYVTNDKQLRNNIDNAKHKFDIVVLNSSELKRYIKLKRILPIDISKISNNRWLSDQFTPLNRNTRTSQHGTIYGMPFTYSSMGMIYHKDRVKTPPSSWNEFWSIAYDKKVLSYDGGTHNTSLAALTLSLDDPFNIPATEQSNVAKKLIALRDNSQTFYDSVEEATQLFNQFELSLMFANFGLQQLTSLQQSGANVAYTIPTEGALAWLDCWAILADTEHSELAHQWINFTLEPWVQLEITQRHGLQSPLAQFSPKTQQQKLIWLAPVESPHEREAMWDAVYSGKSLEKVMEHTKRAEP
ncbi:ABC transporter substrate-binding protein [Vibrio methylphosphonaticus]|uniref:ABC transporter substrate-binding protein n=1 Tax=Vibrio methylphosphonaticus TaxID=2946866 RepID=UPI00202A34C9|nr:extracellular solute-binding protein [Vibrio methylphosphonaticus]MCL9774845.1 extracellular solute-binding protein [Vibrio methylphosphonaticus]